MHNLTHRISTLWFFDTFHSFFLYFFIRFFSKKKKKEIGYCCWFLFRRWVRVCVEFWYRRRKKKCNKICILSNDRRIDQPLFILYMNMVLENVKRKIDEKDFDYCWFLYYSFHISATCTIDMAMPVFVTMKIKCTLHSKINNRLQVRDAKNGNGIK